ncbi:hypothetical protein LJC07_02300 [Christensenellaceae bacterium OttesenSCG-928-L17]|nr:hypothetical protein [Christensenellaceae bacterium OttesenSCG-928-L17]
MSYCTQCGTETTQETMFCPGCGSLVPGAMEYSAAQAAAQEAESAAAQAVDMPASPLQETLLEAQAHTPVYGEQPVYGAASNTPDYNAPVYGGAPIYNVPRPTQESAAQEPQKTPGAWAYFGWLLAMCIPLAGFVVAIVFACASTNVHRRNLARGVLLVYAVLLLLLIVQIGMAVRTMENILDGDFDYYDYFDEFGDYYDYFDQFEDTFDFPSRLSAGVGLCMRNGVSPLPCTA